MDSQRSPVPTFWMFIVVGLIITLSFGVTAIWRSAQQPLDNARDDFVYIQNRLIEDRIDYQFESISSGLQYLAQRPVILSAILGESQSHKGVRDLLAEFDLIGSLTHIEVIDVLGDRIGVSTLKPAWFGVYSGPEIVDLAMAQLDSTTPRFGSRYVDDQNILVVSVPVLHQGLVEGAIVGNFHLELNRREFDGIQLRSAVLHEPGSTVTESPDGSHQITRTLERSGLTLQTSWDFSRLDADKEALVLSLSKSVLVAVTVAFIALGLVGQGLIVRPQKLLARSREELLESEQRASELAEVAESANDGVVITDNAGKVLWANKSMIELSGYALSELIGKTPGEVLQGPDSCFDTRLKMRAALSAAEPVRTEILNYTKSGEPYWVEIAIVPVFNSRRALIRFIAIERDITAQKERQELEKELQASRKLEAVGQLAAGIAHEINTPCQFVGDNIHFFAEAMEDTLPVLMTLQSALDTTSDEGDGELDTAQIRALLREADLGFYVEELPGAVDQAKDGITRISEIVRAMKDFSHPGTDKQAVDLNRSIDSCLTVTRSEWKYIAELDTRFAEELPDVFVSPGEINQVCVNILVNAAHAVAERYAGGTTVRGRIGVSTEVCDGGVRIAISDNGCGMPEGVKAKIFDPFFTTKEVGKGTGQGLAIAYDIIVNRHHGSLQVDSEDGVGTTFIIELPLGDALEHTEDVRHAA